MLTGMSRPSVTYVCRNPKCPWVDERREVDLKVAGVGLYERPGPVVCECNPRVVLYVQGMFGSFNTVEQSKAESENEPAAGVGG